MAGNVKVGKGSTISTTTNNLTDTSTNVAAGGTLVGSGGTIINQALDAELARDALFAGSDATLAALEAGNRQTDSALGFAGDAAADAFDTVTSNTREALGFAADTSADAFDFGGRSINAVENISGDALALAEEVNRESLRSFSNVAADAFDVARDSTAASRAAAQLVADSTGENLIQSLDFGRDVVGELVTTQGAAFEFGQSALDNVSSLAAGSIDAQGAALNDALGFGREVLASSDTRILEVLEQSNRAQAETLNFARALGERATTAAEAISADAIGNLTENKRDPDSSLLQTLAKWAAIAASIIAVAKALGSLFSKGKTA